jgi:hypothetical protein
MAEIKKANRADLSAAKKVEKVVKPAAADLSIAERRPAGQFHLDINAKKPNPNYLRAYRDLYKDIRVPPHKDLHRDLHCDLIFRDRDRIALQIADGVTLDRSRILQLEKIGGKIENNKLTIAAEKVADLEQFIIKNDLKSMLKV